MLVRKRESHGKQNRQSCGECNKVNGVRAHRTSFLDLWDQISGTDVKEVPRCKGNEKVDIDRGRDSVHDQTADEEGQPREEVVE